MSSALLSHDGAGGDGVLYKKKDSLASPTLEDAFFPFASQRRESLLTPNLADPPQEDPSSLLLERDLILAAELGQALLERNEELGAKLEERDKEIEGLQQQCHELRGRLEVSRLEWAQRVAELEADLGAARDQLERQNGQERDRRREDTSQLAQLSNHNQKLVEQLAEAVTVEHGLRSELRALREEYEEKDLRGSVTKVKLDSLHAENRVLQDRKALMEQRLQTAHEESERLRAESHGLRDRMLQLQEQLQEREKELAQERSEAFELRTINHTLQGHVQALGDEVSLTQPSSFPLSLKSEIEQSQAQDSSFVPVEKLREREEELQKLKQELESKDSELESLRAEVRKHDEQPSHSSLEEELNHAREERDALHQQLLNTIKHKVALSQEVEAWQEDMRLVISQQVRTQGQEEKAREKRASLQRNSRLSRSFRGLGQRAEAEESGGFFSNLFKKI
ncbi:BICD family-like cargo adapter 2 [Amia ocellicauda]|uniref:BICD family-like cargo adapter 2 n=1 Tax=Amia ocellicauda TaxID=2972642 RepID=UPI003464A9D3